MSYLKLATDDSVLLCGGDNKTSSIFSFHFTKHDGSSSVLVVFICLGDTVRSIIAIYEVAIIAFWY